MDPEIAYREWCEACTVKDLPLAIEAASGLVAWLDRGGFYPDGLKHARDFNRFMAFCERHGLRG